MTAPVWVCVYFRWGSMTVIRCESEREADGIVYHNTYYKHRCLIVRVRAWR